MSSLRSGLNYMGSVRAFAFRRSIVDSAWTYGAVKSANKCHPTSTKHLTFRSTPVTLSNKKAVARSFRIHLASTLVDNRLLRLHDSSGLALVINTHDLILQFKIPTRTRRRKGLQDGKFALTVHHATIVECRNAGDGGCLRSRIEIRDLLVCEFECCK